MPQKAGAPKRDTAGKYQKRPHKKATRSGVTRQRGQRPDVPEITPLFDTYGQPKPEGVYFDEVTAERPVRWIEKTLRNYQGRWAGQPLYLMEWQKRLIRELFGWKRDGVRLYRRAYVESPRKSGKSTLASAIALYLAYGDGEAGPQVFFAAYDKDQAAVCYQGARHMIEAAPDLDKQTVIYNSRKEMLLEENPGGVLKCLSKDHSKQYGLNLHGLIFDELMTQKTREQWDALTTAQGSREQPLIFAISTAGWDRESVCFEQHEHSRRIAEGAAHDPEFLGVVYGAPQDADWTQEETWKRANPSLGETVKLDYYRQKAATAEAIPGEQNAFRTLMLSQWVGQEQRMIDMAAWDRCAKELVGSSKRPAFGGLDLASTTDLAAFVVVALNDDGTYDVEPHFFTPADNLRDRGLRDRAPYDVWEEQGYLTATPGVSIDYGYVRQAIHDAAEKYDLQDVGYDKWNSSQLVRDLESDGIKMIQIGQGFAGISSPTKELLRLVVEGKLRHNGHPVLRWNADGCASEVDPAGNIKPSKRKSSVRIDGIYALVMALDGAVARGRAQKRRSAYATHEPMFV